MAFQNNRAEAAVVHLQLRGGWEDLAPRSPEPGNKTPNPTLRIRKGLLSDSQGMLVLILQTPLVAISKPSSRLAKLKSQIYESGFDGSGLTGRGLHGIYALNPKP